MIALRVAEVGGARHALQLLFDLAVAGILFLLGSHFAQRTRHRLLVLLDHRPLIGRFGFGHDALLAMFRTQELTRRSGPRFHGGAVLWNMWQGVMRMKDVLEELEKRRAVARVGGGEKRV